MLLLCNGPYKSGSTWLYNLLEQAAQPEFPPRERCQTRWKHPSLREEELAAFACDPHYADRTFLSKHHFRAESVARFARLAPTHALFFSIERDLADALVSAWHHHQKRHQAELSFEAFYWRFGRPNALGIIVHHRAMRKLQADQVCILSYERLLQDPKTELQQLLKFLGPLARESDPQALIEATSLNRLRSKYDESSVVNGKAFFRSGRAGEGATRVVAGMKRDLLRLQARGSDTAFGRLRAQVRARIHRSRKSP